MPAIRCTSVVVLVVASSLAMFGCRAGEPALDGLWLSDGYGVLAEIVDDRLQLHELTAVSCLPADELTLESASADGSVPVRQDEELLGALRVESKGVFVFQPVSTVSYRTFRRAPTRPAVCDTAVDTGPLATFDVFWTTFREHYPFFELKAVDWNEVRARVRPGIRETTTPEQLFAALREMIAPLEDSHTFLVAEDLDLQYRGIRTDPALAGLSVDEAIGVLEGRFDEALDIVRTEYLVGELQSFCKGHLRFGMLPGNLAYVRLDEEGDYSDEPGFQAQLDTFDAALDALFSEVGEVRGLVLDVRKNYGGSDVLSLALASRLAREEYLAYSKVARLDSDDATSRTPPQDRFVTVTARASYGGPVVQLIGPYTISAGETLTQALMGRDPRIVRVGEATQGVFSDVLARRLPNGWRFGLPNELFLAADGRSFDGPGIPPDVEAPVFRAADLAARRDPALERAIRLLSD